MILKRTFSIILISLLALVANAQVNEDLSLKYLVLEPTIKATANPPVIILLHGYGSNEADLFELRDVFPKNYLVISARAPLTIGGSSFQWFRMQESGGTIQRNAEDITNSRNKIKAFIKEVVSKYHVDQSQIYLSGFSQGAMMSYEVGLTSPELLKGIAPLSGRIFDSVKPLVKASPALTKLKIFIGHGDGDTRVPYSEATDAVTYLKKLGLNPELHTYKGMQHAINTEEMKDLVLWLEQK